MLEGKATVRTPAGEERLGPWDLTCFPAGPKRRPRGPQRRRATIRVLMFSNVEQPTATAYPDSGKIGIWTGSRATT